MTMRRPLKSRGTGWAGWAARALGRSGITPNQISLASVACAAVSAACFILFLQQGGWWWLLPAALFIQLRLLCNLLDGMVAVEGGRQTPTGELYNEIPDRAADVLILVAAGYVTGLPGWGPALGWAAGALAVMTAYLRAFGSSLGAEADFRGPMAKPHRMALVTAACLLGAAEDALWGTRNVLTAALILVCLGALVTCVRRTAAIARHLER